MADISVIYKITSKHNGKCYIGSASYWSKRKSSHINDLLNGKHNKKFQNHVNKYGIDDLEFEILEIVERTKEALLSREQFYIDTLNPEFNICKIAGNCLGVKASDETKQKQREAKLGKKQSAEIIEKRTAKLRGKPRPDLIGKSPPNQGKKASAETIEKLIKSHLGQIAWNKGIPQTEEQKLAHSIRMTGRVPSDEARKKMSDAKKGKRPNNADTPKSEETKAKLCEAWVRRKERELSM